MKVKDRMRASLEKALQLFQKHAGAISSIFVLVAVTLAIFRNFLFLNEWPTGGDALGWVSRSYLYRDNGRWLYMWRPYSFGFVEIVNGLDFFLSTTFQIVQNSPQMVEVFMFLSYLLAAFSAYAFAFRYTHRHLSAFSASLVYVLNHWLTSQMFEVHLEIVFSYALAPLLFLFLDRALERTRPKDILASALVLSIMVTSFHAECIVIYGIFLILFTFFYALTPNRSDPFPGRIKRIAKTYVPLSVVVFSIASFVLLPFLMNARPQYFSPSYGYGLKEAYMYGFKDPIAAFTLGATENWGYVKIVDYQTGLPFPGYSMLFTTLLLLLCYSAVLIRRNRYTYFFAFSAILAVCISMGPNPPFDRFFIWMWYNAPHFSVFRAISRWIMVAALSHAFFVCQFTDILARYVNRRLVRRWSRIFFKVEAKQEASGQDRWTTSIVSISFINRIVRRFHDLLFRLSMLALILTIATPFLSNFFVISTGLRVYKPIQNYLDPYIWMSKQPGDFKIVTVGGHPADFADAAMYTDSGWGHEIGADSSFIHDKPVLQDGGWESLPHSFVNYLRWRVVPDKMSDSLMNILGALGYRFVVLPSYASSTIQEFFMNQKDKHVAHDAGWKILESDHTNQHVFGTSEFDTVIGDTESLLSLSKIDSFSLENTALFFADQLNPPFYENSLFQGSNTIIYVDNSLTDMIMLSLREKEYIVTMENYGASDPDRRVQWIQSTNWNDLGKFTYSDRTIVTSGKKNVDIPFEQKPDGNFSIWIRAIFAPKRGTLTVSIDNVPVKQFKPLSYGPSTFMWVNIGNVQMQAGNHLVTLSNDGSGENDVDAFAVIDDSAFEQQKQIIESSLAGSQNLVGVFEAENVFDYDASSGWRYEAASYSGFVLKSDEKGSDAALEGKANASSVYNGDIVNFGPASTIDGSNITRWASGLGMPQWLEIDWTTPKELSGAEILFEDAKAQDYVFQIWNGTSFIDLPETRTLGNNETTRYHRFSQSVNTNRLRLFVTRAEDHNMVSIYDLRAYTKGRPISTEIYLPKKGNFKLGFRLLSSPDSGTFYFRVDDQPETAWCNSTDNAYEWFYSNSSFSLERGYHNVTVSGIGKIALDTMLLIPAENGSTSSIFSDQPKPTIRYVQINPCEYIVDIEANRSFTLVFSEAYHPLWRLSIGNSEITPIIADHFVNGFYINKTGQFRARLFFAGQIYTDAGLKLSATTLVITIAILAVPSRLFKKIRSQIKRKERK